MLCQILCCIVSRRSVESVGGVFDPIVNSALAVFEHVKDELAVIPCLLLATLKHVRQGVDPSSPWGAHRCGSAQSSPVQSSPVQSTVQCECIRQQLHAALTLPNCRQKRERERVEKDKGIRGSSVSSRATCCLLGVHCRCPQPVHTPHLLKYRFVCRVMAMLRV